MHIAWHHHGSNSWHLWVCRQFSFHLRMIQKLVQCIFFHILSPTIPLKPLRLLRQLKGKTVTTEVCPFRSSAGFCFAVDFCTWIRWQITYARSAGIDGGCDCTWSQPIQGQMHPHVLAVAQCPFSSSLRAAKSVLLAGYRDLLVQLTFCLCVRCQLVHFFPLSSVIFQIPRFNLLHV